MKIIFILLWIIFEIFCILFPERVNLKWDWTYWGDKKAECSTSKKILIRVIHSIILISLILTIISSLAIEN